MIQVTNEINNDVIQRILDLNFEDTHVLIQQTNGSMLESIDNLLGEWRIQFLEILIIWNDFF